jgi:hypothetical protein
MMMTQNETEDSNGFLNELKSQFDRDIDIRNSLESKSTQLITMSSTIVTILVSIGAFLISKISANPDLQNTYPLVYPSIFLVSLGILVSGIVLATICIYFLTKSAAIRKYKYPMGHENFFENDNYDEKEADKFRKYPTEVFNKHMVKEYLQSIKTNSESISEKSGLIKKGQKFLNPAIFTIAILVVFVLGTFGFNLIKLNF